MSRFVLSRNDSYIDGNRVIKISILTFFSSSVLCEMGKMNRKLCWYFVGNTKMEGHSTPVDYTDRISRVDKIK